MIVRVGDVADALVELLPGSTIAVWGGDPGVVDSATVTGNRGLCIVMDGGARTTVFAPDTMLDLDMTTAVADG